MIAGLGVDNFEIKRMNTRLTKEPDFIETIFTPQEIQYCQGKRRPAQHYAARFAAKEAFFKALGSGWRDGLEHRQVEVITSTMGAPKIVLHARAQELSNELNISKVHLSLCHSTTLATAVVILEQI